MEYHIIKSAEEALKFIDLNPPLDDLFELAISDSYTFGMQPDTMGVGMAILFDKILGLEYEPDGFEQMNGFKLYSFKKME